MDFFQERKLLVAWRRTNEISGENLTSENHRSTSVSTQFSEKLEAETKKEKKNRYRRFVRGIDSRLSRRRTGDSFTIPETARPILFPG